MDAKATYLCQARKLITGSALRHFRLHDANRESSMSLIVTKMFMDNEQNFWKNVD